MQDSGAARLQEAERECEKLGRDAEEVRGKWEAGEAAREKLKAASDRQEVALQQYKEELKEIKAAHERHVEHLEDALKTKDLRGQVLEQQHRAAIGSLEAQVTSVTERAGIYQVRMRTQRRRLTGCAHADTAVRAAQCAASEPAARSGVCLAVFECAMDRGIIPLLAVVVLRETRDTRSMPEYSRAVVRVTSGVGGCGCYGCSRCRWC